MSSGLNISFLGGDNISIIYVILTIRNMMETQRRSMQTKKQFIEKFSSSCYEWRTPSMSGPNLTNHQLSWPLSAFGAQTYYFDSSRPDVLLSFDILGKQQTIHDISYLTSRLLT